MKGDMLKSYTGRDHVELMVDPNVVSLILQVIQENLGADTIELTRIINNNHVITHSLDDDRVCWLRDR